MVRVDVVAGSHSSVLAARLELATTSVVRGEWLTYSVVNTGTLPIMLGEAYVFDRLVSDAWELVPGPRAAALWGRRLVSGRRSELTARVPDLAHPGHYLLRKGLQVDRDPYPGYEWVAAEKVEPIVVTAEFEVVAD